MHNVVEGEVKVLGEQKKNNWVITEWRVEHKDGKVLGLVGEYVKKTERGMDNFVERLRSCGIAGSEY